MWSAAENAMPDVRSAVTECQTRGWVEIFRRRSNWDKLNEYIPRLEQVTLNDCKLSQLFIVLRESVDTKNILI